MQTRTFLFADLREYTRFVEHHGDEAAATLIGDYRRLVRGEVGRAGGAEVKTEGDSFYVVFESATAALRCGMAILREADRYSIERPDRPMRVGVGIHAGEPQAHEGQFVGEAVIVAARLAQLAAPGELLVTELVRGLSSRTSLPAMTERSGLVLKGIDAPPKVYAVSWARSARRSAGAPTPHAAVPGRPLEGGIVAARELVGRESERAALDALFADALDGAGRLTFVSGDAGIGKSALVRDFISDRAREADILIGECSEFEGHRPFGPVIDAFMHAGLRLPDELVALGPGAQAAVESQRNLLNAALVGSLVEHASRQAVVLVLEDIHWADPATLDVLSYLPRRMRSARVLVIATYRPEEAARGALDATVARLQRARLAIEIRLRPLDEDGTARLVMSALRLDRAPTTEFRAAIHERCDGNPFFTEEVLRTLVERGEITYRDGMWRRERAVRHIDLPRTISAAVDQRLGELAPETLQILRVAAVIGVRFDFDLLASVGAFTEADVIAALTAAVRQQLVVEEGSNGTERYRFWHALTREVVLAGLLGRQRRLLHGAIARELERRAGADTGRWAEDLAYHYDEAGEVEPTIRYRVLAAERASRTSSYASVQRHLERAVELAPEDHPELDRLYLKLSRAAFNAADHRRAEQAAREAMRLSEERGRLLLQGAAAAALAGVAFAVGRADDRRASLKQAIELLEPLGPTVELADAYVLELAIAWFERDPAALSIGKRAVATADQAGSTWAKVRALNLLGLIMFHIADGGDESAAVRNLREALELARTYGFVDLTERALTNLDSVLVDLGASAQEHGRLRAEMLAHAAQYGYRSEDEWQEAYESGDWDRALEIIDETAGASLFAAKRGMHAAIIRAFRLGPTAGLSAAGPPRVQLISAATPQWTRHAAAVGVIRFLAGDLPGAVAEARLAIGLPPEVYVEDALVAGILAALELGDAEALVALIARAKRQLTRLRSGLEGDPKSAAFPVAFAAFARGIEAEGRGDTLAALAEHDVAAISATEWGRPFTATQARLRRARLFASMAQAQAARAEIEAVLPYWQRARATWYLAALAGVADQLGGARINASGR